MGGSELERARAREDAYSTRERERERVKENKYNSGGRLSEGASRSDRESFTREKEKQGSEREIVCV